VEVTLGTRWRGLGAILATIIIAAACGSSPTAAPESISSSAPSSSMPATATTTTSAPTSASVVTTTTTSTTTTTVGGGIATTTTSPALSRCDGLSGELEIQVLVGPAEAVGLEPVAVGSLPFTVVSGDGVYLVQGGGDVSYDAVLEQRWGTYSVSLDMAGTVDGECSGEDGSEILNLAVQMSGEQMVEVRAEGFQGDYPWSGTHELDVSFPIEEGATASGEGWAFVLHLSS
jgi:hypothetical protein